MKVFITGLTGTLGTALARLHRSQGDMVSGCARSEARAVTWLANNRHLEATLLLADAESLANPQSEPGRLLPTIDKMYHCAAMKHVDLCEVHPLEALRENVTITSAVAIACSTAKVPMVLISSDKACLPGGVYGLTKMLAEKIAIREGAAAVRLGNLIGSSGSVFSIWKTAVAANQPIRVTDRSMTRFFIGVEEAARFVAEESIPGSVVIRWPMILAQMGTVAEAVAYGKVPITEIGRRPGETQHQWLISPDEGYREAKDKLILDPSIRGDGIGICSSIGSHGRTSELLKLIGI